MTTVSIIGSAGRNRESFTQDLFDNMCEKAENTIRDDFQLKRRNVILVSGGSAWSP